MSWSAGGPAPVLQHLQVCRPYDTGPERTFQRRGDNYQPAPRQELSAIKYTVN